MATKSFALRFILALFMFIATVQARGRVENKSNTVIRYADFGGGPDHCDVLNWPGGRRIVKCKQYTLGPGQSRGGFPDIDVDGFTFFPFDYSYQLPGQGYKTAPGETWIKINDLQTARCYRDPNPRCVVNNGF
jgi:hypothetical protein